ncbi:hypothetical protein LOZ10_002029, partial [Ophidiomyces ophidiicola]
MRAITITSPDGKFGKPGQVYYPLALRDVPQPTPQGNELLIQITAAALNHRDLFIRQHLYPGVSFDTPLLADGVGTVVGAGPDVAHPETWLHQRVVLNPGFGWQDSPDGPETAAGYAIMGGTLQEFIALDAREVERAPTHLSDAEAAALPLTGLTAWRALVTKAGERNSRAGAAVLITGIGGGVALMALRFAVARGADVYVTSSSAQKLQQARDLGARGGANYKEAGWEKQLLAQLPPGKTHFDAIIDGAGGDVVDKAVKLLKAGGVLSVYGMTVGPKMPFTMSAVLKNIDVKGSTMGSRKEFRDMVQFVAEQQLHPIVWRVVQGLDNIQAIDSLFDDMKAGSQFGKLVIQIANGGGSE